MLFHHSRGRGLHRPTPQERFKQFYSLGTNKIGFEDLKGGVDRDSQDLVQIFDFKID